MIDPGGYGVASLLLGGGGIGLVWGWCAVLPIRRARHRARSLLAITALAAVSAAVLRLVSGGWPASIAFAAAAAAAGWLHAAWLHQLQTSFIRRGHR